MSLESEDQCALGLMAERKDESQQYNHLNLIILVFWFCDFNFEDSILIYSFSANEVQTTKDLLYKRFSFVFLWVGYLQKVACWMWCSDSKVPFLGLDNVFPFRALLWRKNSFRSFFFFWDKKGEKSEWSLFRFLLLISYLIFECFVLTLLVFLKQWIWWCFEQHSGAATSSWRLICTKACFKPSE